MLRFSAMKEGNRVGSSKTRRKNEIFQESVLWHLAAGGRYIGAGVHRGRPLLSGASVAGAGPTATNSFSFDWLENHNDSVLANRQA